MADVDMEMAVFAFDSGDVATASGKIYFCHPTQGICIIEELLLREPYVARIVLKPLHQKSLRADNFRRLDFSEFSRLGFRVEFVFSATASVTEGRVVQLREDGHVEDQDDDVDGIPLDGNEDDDSLLDAISGIQQLDEGDDDSEYDPHGLKVDAQPPGLVPRPTFRRGLGGALIYQCPTCGRRYRKRKELNLHMTVHTGDKPFACSKCEYRGKNLFFLKRHMRHHTGEKPFRCEECNEGFTLYQTLDRHVRKIHRGNRTRCSVNGVFKIKEFSLHECLECGKDFDSRAALEHHVRIHTGDKPFPCDLCSAKFRTKDEVIRHKRRHDEGKKVMVPCDDCGAKVALSKMDDHRRKHIEGEVFKCQYCTKVFYGEVKRKNHEAKYHTQDFRYECDMCGFKCVTEWGLNSHRGKAHKSGNKLTQSKTSRSRPAVSGPPPPLARYDDPMVQFQDDYVDEDEDDDDPYFAGDEAPPLAPVDPSTAEPIEEEKRTQARQQLKRPKSYQCKDCGGKFTSPENLELHRLAAEPGEQPFICKFCGSPFETSCLLRSHEVIEHTKSYPYLCTYCDFGSFLRKDVEIHEKRHRNPVSELYVPESDRRVAISQRMSQLRERQREKENVLLRAAGIAPPYRYRKRRQRPVADVSDGQIEEDEEYFDESSMMNDESSMMNDESSVMNDDQSREIDQSIQAIVNEVTIM